MDITYGYQFFDFDPEHVEMLKGHVDFEKAIYLFHNFPWDEQFRKLAVREESNSSSLFPGIYFYKTKSHYLVVKARTNDAFIIYYEKDNLWGELYISNSFVDKPADLSVEAVIASFFNSKLHEILNLFPKEEVEDEGKQHFKIRKTKEQLYRPLLFLFIPFIVLFFGPTSGGTVFIFFLGEIAALFLIVPDLYLNWRYWQNDQNQTIEINSSTKRIRLVKGGAVTEFSKNEIESCDLVRVRSSQRAWNDYGYLRLKTANNTFIITHFTAAPEELLYYLQIHFKKCVVFFPAPNFKIVSAKEKQKMQERLDKKKEEFLEIYQHYDSSKLEGIVKNQGEYATYAISAAKEILAKRSSSAVTNPK